MANLQRLTERVKKMEDWVKENEDMGGPKGILETVSFLINESRRASMIVQQLEGNLNGFRNTAFEFIQQHELADEWNEFLQEKEKNAVQKQQTEEVSVQEEAKSGEETVEAPKEESSEKKD